MNKNLKIIVTGVKGQLGYDVCRELKNRGYTNYVGIDIDDLDLTNKNDIDNFFEIHKPDVVINNAAWTAVDKAEEFKEKVYEVNALAVKYLSQACKKHDSKLIQISTDYVFEGNGNHYYQEDDRKGPLGTYGKTKSEGEDFVLEILDKYFIVRISWVFGINGNNFIKTMLRLAETKTELNVVCDQIGSPTYTMDLSKLLCDMIESEKYGIYHATNEGVCSWYDFTNYIFEVANVTSVKVNPITTLEYQKLVKQAFRPLNSRMSKDKLDREGFNRLPHWKDAVKRYIKNELGR